MSEGPLRSTRGRLYLFLCHFEERSDEKPLPLNRGSLASVGMTGDLLGRIVGHEKAPLLAGFVKLSSRGANGWAKSRADRCRGILGDGGLADQLVILRVRPDPEPQNAVIDCHSECAVPPADADRPEAADLLEMK